MHFVDLLIKAQLTVRFVLHCLVVRQRKGANGGDAAAQHVMDRGAVPEEGRRRSLSVSANTDVHLCLRLLPSQK